jgi:hypothetical protein
MPTVPRRGGPSPSGAANPLSGDRNVLPAEAMELQWTGGVASRADVST